MNENKYNPTFLVMLEIAKVLRDCVNNINELYEESIKEAKKIWEKL